MFIGLLQMYDQAPASFTLHKVIVPHRINSFQFDNLNNRRALDH
jgi:hypothetical protein